MRRMKIGVVDLVARGPTRTFYSRAMYANFASIMPQVIAAWCEELGHDVRYLCYTGVEELLDPSLAECDLVFVGAFTEAAHLAYALSAGLRASGAVTALGGPHARCFAADARKHFDYVLGFTDRATVLDVLQDCSPYRHEGALLSAAAQPTELPSLRARWRFVRANRHKSPFFGVVPILGSMGCPYDCDFCIDARIPHQRLAKAAIQDDLRFLLQEVRRPSVAWHDPNFGVRLDDDLDAIEEVVPKGRMRFVAESSLSVLSEQRLRRLQRNGFVAVLPGIESWFSMGKKSRTGASSGRAKVEKIAEHIQVVLRYVPYVQANFVLGLDAERGAEPYELTKLFLRRVPGVFPGYSLLTAFGDASPSSEALRAEGRVLPFPFPLLDNNRCMNIRPEHETWARFYDHVIDLMQYSFSWGRIARRFLAARSRLPRWMNLLRAFTAEGRGRTRYHREIRRRLDEDPEFAPFFEQQTTKVPGFYTELLQRELGAMARWLPASGPGQIVARPHTARERASPLLAPRMRVRPQARLSGHDAAGGGLFVVRELTPDSADDRGQR